MKSEFGSKAEKDTGNLAKLFAEEILKTKAGKKALAVGLVGELGAGKTAFVKALLRTLGVKGRVASPTFIFSRRYKPRLKHYKNIWHFDVYRLTSTKGIKEIGLKEAIADEKNIVLVEWADKVKGILPKGTIWIEFRHGAKSNERHITFNRR